MKTTWEDSDADFATMQQLVAESQCLMDDIALVLLGAICGDTGEDAVKVSRILAKAKRRLISRGELSWRQFGYFPHINLIVVEKAERDYEFYENNRGEHESEA